MALHVTLCDMTYATLRVSKRFVAWLKDTAQTEHKFMYRVLEEICEKSLGGRPWEVKRKTGGRR